MIQSTADLASELVWCATHPPADELKYGDPVTANGIVPPTSTFSVQTVEGKRFRVTVTEDTEVHPE